MLGFNPLGRIKLRKPRPGTKPVLNHEQVRRIIAAADASDRPMLATLAFTGMRSGEVKNLLRGDVDLAGGRIHVVSRPPEAPTKTGLDWKAPIHPVLAELLGRLPVRRDRHFFTERVRGNAFKRRAIDAGKLNDCFRDILEQLGIPSGLKAGGFTIHSLRHYFGTKTGQMRCPQE